MNLAIFFTQRWHLGHIQLGYLGLTGCFWAGLTSGGSYEEAGRSATSLEQIHLAGEVFFFSGCCLTDNFYLAAETPGLP